MSKNLAILQTLSKIGRIICKIVYIFSIISVISSLLSLIMIASSPSLVTQELDMLSQFADGTGIEKITVGSLYVILTAGFITSLTQLILSKIGERYFRNELEAGTPFTFEGANELLRFGIIYTVLPIISTAVIMAIQAVIAKTLEGADQLELSGGNITLGISMIVISVIFKYGAEFFQKQQNINTTNTDDKNEDNYSH